MVKISLHPYPLFLHPAARLRLIGFTPNALCYVFYALRLTLYALRFVLYALCFALYALRFALCALRFVLYA